MGSVPTFMGYTLFPENDWKDESAQCACLVATEGNMKPRTAPRVPVKVPAIFTLGSVPGQGKVLDFSIPGCLMESSLSVRVGDRIQLKCFIPAPQPPLCVTEGVVRWVKGTRFAVEFVQMSEKDRRQLNQFVKMLLSRHPQDGKGGFSESGGHNWHLDIHSCDTQ